MFEVQWPWIFLLLPLPWLVGKFFSKNSKLEGARLKAPFLSKHSLSQQPIADGKKSIYKSITAWLIWLCLLASASQPVWVGDPITLPAEGRDIMLAVDLSGSMEMDDMVINQQRVNRLDMTKYVLKDFIQRRLGDRLGLILFADTAYLQTPLTRDLNTVAQMLDESIIGLVGDKTAIGDAIGLAAKRFSQKENSNKILILLTDGQNTSGNLQPSEALQLAKSEGIKIYTIGVGADEMLVKGFFGYQKRNPSADLDESTLNQIAQETGGLYFRARDAQELSKIYAELDKLEPVSEEAIQLRPQTSLFYWPLTIAFILTVLLSITPMLLQFTSQLGGKFLTKSQGVK
ncbi:von Willebrand factor type A [Catenovulum agarivorans DS-2]|uniref:von Willebrand factor type A n=1 Tax=Catenovulum agarivorans DS-2 TaxID=1328313 RepID=W7QB48_9ALTE|nr:VWA domain-containing protein [Catenovulum agarivorans]EWH09191.1 von Willebrand factor type A [Catenovulum agarivorans DS-2]